MWENGVMVFENPLTTIHALSRLNSTKKNMFDMKAKFEVSMEYQTSQLPFCIGLENGNPNQHKMELGWKIAKTLYSI